MTKMRNFDLKNGSTASLWKRFSTLVSTELWSVVGSKLIF